MEAYFSVVAKPTSKRKADTSLNGRSSNMDRSAQTNFHKTLPSTITNALLNTLSDPLNPITHSDIYNRTDHIVSCSSGHQVSNGGRYEVNHPRTLDRNTKLGAQQQEIRRSSDNCGILNGTRIYINGYLESTTDIEMKRLVLEAGGQIVISASQCTHVLTSRGLSGSKTHSILTRRTKSVYVVKPEWVLDSIAMGKRRPERSYAIVKQANTLQSFLEVAE